MRFFHKTFITISLAFMTQVYAFTPESGFWWNPDESGSGYSIEIQDNYMFIALYVYDEAGNPTWYSAATHLGGNSLFNSELNYTYDGTCLDCSYTRPITIHGDKGPITIEFLTEITATIQFQGAVKHIERFNFKLGDNAERMLGEWQSIIDFSSTGTQYPFNGDVMLFESTSFSDGDKYADGCRPDNTTDGFCSNFALDNHELAAVYDEPNNQLLMVVSDDQNYWLAYYVELGLNQFDGVVEYYPKNGGHNNVYYPVRGFRTASRSFVETGVDPSKRDKYSDKEVVGIMRSLDVNLPSKDLSSFSKMEQTSMLRKQTIIQTLINRLESK